jgi:hypothetical protein
VSGAATTPPAAPPLTAAGLGGGGGFRDPEEYLAHLRSLGVTRFPYADQPEGRPLDDAALQLGASLAHFLDTFRAVHPGGWRAGVDEVRALVTNAPRGLAPDELDRQVRQYAGALAILPTGAEPTPSSSTDPEGPAA